MMIRPLLRRTWSPKPIYTRWLYEGVIIPMLTYGSAVWGHAAQKVTIRKKLSSLQRIGLTAITFVPKGTPTMGMELIYDLPPLHLRIQECALGTFLRLGEIQEVAWIPKSKTKIGHLRWLRQLPNTVDDDVITMVANLTIPYCIQIDTTLPPATAGICVYTDGSLLEEHSGAGVYIEVDRQPQVTMSKRLPPCTVFQSELRAIQMACEHLCLHQHNNKDIHIHVYSQAALQSLIKSQITSKTVHQTVELLRELAGRHTVTLQWVKAHVGIPGNEMADEAAKAGSQSIRFTQMEISDSRTELKTFIRDARNLEWADREGKDCRQTRLFFPTLNPKVRKDIKAYSNLTSTCLARIKRFLTGHTFMNCHEVLIQRGRDDLESNDALC
jgi:ribonuclease HI